MKKKTLTAVMIVCSLFSANSFSANRMVMIEEAIESNSLQIRMSHDLTGVVNGRICDSCELVLVKITPNSKLEINGKPTALSQANKCSGKTGLVLYNIKSREISLISCNR
ncbi:MAG: hypothetical protein OEY11_08660 [Gammaproteobacteria bacterium]|nr:hypothetical protein [Gammaproteobacteria bacterium]